MWTEADRSTYRQAGDRLPSDLSDGERERLAPLIPPAKPGGRPRKTDMRSAMNAIFYLLRTGCPWRYLPRRVFPPRSTVYNIFRAFQRQGVWEAIWEELRAALRERLGGGEPQRRRHRQLLAQVGRKGGCAKGEADAVGYDAGKRVKGRKVHALVDTEGLPLRVVVHSAAIQDRDGAALVFDRIRQRFNWLELVWAHGGYNARQVEHAVAAQPPLRVEIVKRPDGSSTIHRPAASLGR